MNSISWLIYLAGVASGVKTVLSISAVLLLFACVVMLVAYAVEHVKLISLITCVGAACALVAAVVPSERTVLMIAASELAERAIVNTGADQLIEPSVQMLHNWVRREIERSLTTN